MHDLSHIDRMIRSANQLCTGTARGQSLGQTLEYFEQHVLGKGKCYLPEAQIVYEEMQQFAEQFIRDLRAGLEGA
jgi:uncharacterized protein